MRALGAASDALLQELESGSSTSKVLAIEQLLGEIERLREEVPAGDEASRALDHAEELFEAARLALDEGGEEPDGEGPGLGLLDEEEGESGRGGARGGTMSEFDPRAETPSTGIAHGGWEGPEGALGPGTYWPEEHRGVVRRWIEKVRTQEREHDD